MALAADVALPIMEGEYTDLPVLANAIIYEGSVVSITAAGYAKAYAGTDTIFAGIAHRGVDATGYASGALRVKVRTDIHRRIVTLTGAALADAGDALYASDDGTFTKTAGSNLLVGKIEQYYATNQIIARFETWFANLADAIVTTSKLYAGAATLPKQSWSGLKLIAITGVDSTSGNQEVTATGSAVGDRVVGIFGHTTANSGTHGFLVPVIGTAFESTISVVNKIVQLQAAGNLAANSYLVLLLPAAA